MRRRRGLIVGLIVGVATVNLAANIGSSALYVDEGHSWRVASQPTLGDVVDGVRGLEVSPPLHFLGLHEVLLHVSSSEIALRVPSALAGIALVVAILWLGTRTAGATAGLLAAGLAALSPLVLEYGQQARAYVFAMLAATLSAGALLEAERSPPGAPARRWWLAAFAAASIVGYWTHYTVGVVFLVLVVGSVLRGGLRRGEAIAVSGALGAACLLAVPIMLDQFGEGRSEGLAYLGGLDVANLVELIGAPFDTRYDFFDLTPSAAVGAAAVAVAAVLALAAPSREWPLVRSLVLPVAFAPVAAILLVTIVGTDVLLTRYVAVAVPFMLVLVGAVHHAVGTRTAAAILALAGLSAIAGSLLGHTEGGRYADFRAAAGTIAEADRPGDVVVLTHPAHEKVFAYYAQRGGLTRLPAQTPPDPAVVDWVRQARRLWMPIVFPPERTIVERDLEKIGYRAERTWDFEGSEPVRLVLATPDPRRTVRARR